MVTEDSIMVVLCISMVDGVAMMDLIAGTIRPFARETRSIKNSAGKCMRMSNMYVL